MVKIQVNSQGKAYLVGGNKLLVADSDTITATNKSSSAITSGSKVWVNKNFGNYEAVDLASYSKYNTVGSINIDTSFIASGFSGTDYLQLPFVFNPSNFSWEIVFKVKTGNDISVNQAIFGNYGASFQNSPQVSIFGSVFRIDIPRNPISSNHLFYKTGTYTPLPDTWYWLKLSFNGTSYKLDYSLDGVTFVNDITENNSTAMGVGTEGFVIGHNYYSASSVQYWRGSIDLLNCYIKINGLIWWQPYSAGINKSTTTGIAQENIAVNNSGSVKIMIPEV